MKRFDHLHTVRFDSQDQGLRRWHTVAATGCLRRQRRGWLLRSLQSLVKWSRFLLRSWNAKGRPLRSALS
ncbi:hypothetical protein JST97_22265 [bacterium]|nr:hypothetical protein [bacterium]